MKLRRHLSLFWTDSPWIVRMGVVLVFVILALLFFGPALKGGSP